MTLPLLLPVWRSPLSLRASVLVSTALCCPFYPVYCYPLQLCTSDLKPQVFPSVSLSLLAPALHVIQVYSQVEEIAEGPITPTPPRHTLDTLAAHRHLTDQKTEILRGDRIWQYLLNSTVGQERPDVPGGSPCQAPVSFTLLTPFSTLELRGPEIISRAFNDHLQLTAWEISPVN